MIRTTFEFIFLFFFRERGIGALEYYDARKSDKKKSFFALGQLVKILQTRPDGSDCRGRRPGTTCRNQPRFVVKYRPLYIG